MPFPMVHLYVAHELKIINKIDDLPQFYLGILAADAYNQRTEKSIEDRNISHLTADDTAEWKNSAIQFMEQKKRDNQKWFYIGYGVHILTDIYWDSVIYKPFLLKYSQENASSSDSRQAYRSDMTMIDVWLYRNCEFKNDIWSYLSDGKSFNVKGLVTAAEINAERDFTLAWYDKEKEQNIDNFKYITPEQVTEFIRKAANDIDSQLLRIL